MEPLYKVNDFVCIDGKERGRIVFLGTFLEYNVKLLSGEVREVARYRCKKVAEAPVGREALPASLTYYAPFYLATNTKQASAIHPWFKRQPVGVNKLGTIMRRMSKNAGLENQRFTNHSARNYLVQKLVDGNIPPTEIMQISGHRNVQSINNYSSLSMNRHRDLSQIVSNHSTAQRSLALVGSRQNESSLPSTAVVATTTCSYRSSNELVQSIFSAPTFGGTININFYGPDSKKMKLNDN